MGKIRTMLGKQFETYAEEAAKSAFMGQFLVTADREELLALIGWLHHEHEGRVHYIRDQMHFAGELKSA